MQLYNWYQHILIDKKAVLQEKQSDFLISIQMYAQKLVSKLQFDPFHSK